MTEIIRQRVKAALADRIVEDFENGSHIWNTTNTLRRVNIAGQIREDLCLT